MLSGVTRTRVEATLTFARTSVVLQLYTGAVGRGVDVHRDGMRLQLDLLGDAGGAQAVQTQS